MKKSSSHIKNLSRDLHHTFPLPGNVTEYNNELQCWEQHLFHDSNKIKLKNIFQQWFNNAGFSFFVVFVFVFHVCSNQVSYGMTDILQTALYTAELPKPQIGLLAVQKASLIHKHLVNNTFVFFYLQKMAHMLFSYLTCFFPAANSTACSFHLY